MFNRFNFNAHKKGAKYGNTKVNIDGIVFDSKIESQRYLFLKEKQNNNEISDLQCHVTYELIPRQTEHITEVKHLKTKDKIIEKERVIFHSISFSPDFIYKYNGKIIAEDVKGSKLLVSKDFPLRQKLLYFYHKIYVHVITKATAPIPSQP